MASLGLAEKSVLRLLKQPYTQVSLNTLSL